MKYKIFYVIFLITCFIYPFEYVIGPIAIRHIFAFIMLVWLVSIKQVKSDRNIWLYLSYLFCATLSSFLTGYIGTFLPALIGTFFLCIILYYATKAMILKFNALSWIITALVSLAIIDSIVTIAQFYNSPIARIIADTLRVSLIDEETWSQLDFSGGAVGGLTAVGLLRGVKNGYFLSAAVVLVLYSKKDKIKIYNWLLMPIILFALFVTQERAAFFLGSISVLSYIMINSWRKTRQISEVLLVTLIFFAVFEFLGLADSFSFSDTRYDILGSEATGREKFFSDAMTYVLIHPLGGMSAYLAQGGYPPHHFIPNSFLYGGIIGGLIVTFLVALQIFISIKVLYESFIKKKYSMIVVAMAIIYLSYTGSSCFHNLALATGDESFFLWWAILSSQLYKENNMVV